MGSVFFIPTIVKFIPAQASLSLPVPLIIILSVAQSVIAVTLFSWLGTIFSLRIGFYAKLIDVSMKDKRFWIILREQVWYGAAIGCMGAMIAYVSAPGFIQYLSFYPIISRIGGSLFEEVIIRWGLLTLIIWILWRIFQRRSEAPKNIIIWSGIVLNQLLFAAGHIFALTKIGVPDVFLSVVIIFLVSSPWGWLFWKKGIEAAFIAHMCFHIVIILMKFVGLGFN